MKKGNESLAKDNELQGLEAFITYRTLFRTPIALIIPEIAYIHNPTESQSLFLKVGNVISPIISDDKKGNVQQLNNLLKLTTFVKNNKDGLRTYKHQ